MKKLGSLVAAVLAGAILIFCTISCATTKKVPENTTEPTAPVVTEPEKQPVEPEKQPEKVPEQFTKKGFVEQVQQALKTGTAEDALKLYDTIPAEYADDFDLLVIKASLLVSANKLDEAEALCKTLQTREPDNTDVMELSAVIAKAKGDKTAKNKQLTAILAKDPNNAVANIALADDAIMDRNYKKAQSYYAKALTKEPNNTDALLGYGQTCYFREDDDRAEDLFNKVIANDPNNDSAYYYLGKLAYVHNEYKTATDNIEKAIAINGDRYDYYLDYGRSEE